MRYLLGIDLGTTGLKAVVFDLEGRPRGKGLTTNPYLARPRGWAEQDPRDWWDGCCRAVHAALAESGIDPGLVAGVGVCGFHHVPVFLDGQGEPTRPSIVTHDGRLGGSLEELRRSGILDEVVRISGSQVMSGHFPAIYHHVLSNDREALDKSRWIVLAKDYLRFKLTARIGTEICDATGTNLVAMPEQDWSEHLCKLLEVPREKLPAIGNPSEFFGQVTPEAAAATGLRAGTPVVYGGGDSHCALLGLGVVDSGEVGLLLGTNSTLRACFEGLVRHFEHTVWVQQHVVPERYTVSASSMAGASVLAWFRELFLTEDASEVEGPSYDQLESLAAGVPAGCDGLLFHPYIYGERSPFCNPQARGAFLAIAHWHRKGHFVRSVMEGIAFCIANCFDAIQAIASGRQEQIKSIRTGAGGGSRLPTWRQVITDALGYPLEVVGIEEPGCWGAALLASIGVGQHSGFPATVQIASRIWPDPERVALYRARRKVFNDAYSVLDPLLHSG